jgi:ribosomal protein S27AE
MTIQRVRCPNCGAFAERHFLTAHELTRTVCQTCDYLLISCTRTGNVVESYAPGICARR